MTIDELINVLEREKAEHGGDVPVNFTTVERGEVVHKEVFFVSLEETPDEKYLDIRDFPY